MRHYWAPLDQHRRGPPCQGPSHSAALQPLPSESHWSHHQSLPRLLPPDPHPIHQDSKHESSTVHLTSGRPDQQCPSGCVRWCFGHRQLTFVALQLSSWSFCEARLWHALWSRLAGLWHRPQKGSPGFDVLRLLALLLRLLLALLLRLLRLPWVLRLGCWWWWLRWKELWL